MKKMSILHQLIYKWNILPVAIPMDLLGTWQIYTFIQWIFRNFLPCVRHVLGLRIKWWAKSLHLMKFILMRKAESKQKQINKNIILCTGKDYEKKHRTRIERMVKEALCGGDRWAGTRRMWVSHKEWKKRGQT